MAQTTVSTTISAAIKLPPVELADDEVVRLMQVFTQGKKRKFSKKTRCPS
jgi:hypothetical protein